MNPYLITLTFLLLMSILTSSEVLRFSQAHFASHLYASSQEQDRIIQSADAHALLDDFRGEEREKIVYDEGEKRAPKPGKKVRRSPSLQFDLARPPNNSRLNFYQIIHGSPPKKFPLSLYDTAVRLMDSLYGEASFFKAVPGAAARIMNALIAENEKSGHFTTPDELATLTFEDPTLQEVFYAMLKGEEKCPSLLNYITFDRAKREDKKINLLFASKELIEALLNHPVLSEKLIALRNRQWVEIFDEETHRLERPKELNKGRLGFKNELSAGYEALLDEEGLHLDSYKTVFDLSLNKMGSVLFIEDPETGFIHRERHLVKK